MQFRCSLGYSGWPMTLKKSTILHAVVSKFLSERGGGGASAPPCQRACSMIIITQKKLYRFLSSLGRRSKLPVTVIKQWIPKPAHQHTKMLVMPIKMIYYSPFIIDRIPVRVCLLYVQSESELNRKTIRMR